LPLPLPTNDIAAFISRDWPKIANWPALCSIFCVEQHQPDTNMKECIMIAHRRNWFYRLAGQKFAHAISFKMPMTAHQVRDELERMFSITQIEIWGR
jgi:hypothetical protein